MPALTLTGRRPTYGTGTKTAYSGTAGSTTVTGDTNTVILWCSSTAYVRVGGTATTADLCLPGGMVAEIPVDNKTGGPITVSAIRDTADGSLYCIGSAE